MGWLDRFRRKAPPEPTRVASSPAPCWEPKPPLVAAMEVSMILTGRADDPNVLEVHRAVETHLAKVFGNQVPLGWCRVPPGPLAYVRTYWTEGERGPFFHYLGWGLTEMGPKASHAAETSGFGIELTMKVRAFPEERVSPSDELLAQKAPLWPVELLARLAVAVQRSGRPFGHDHWIEAGVQGFGPENLRHLACAVDDALGPVDTLNGRFRYLQIYSIDDGELEQFKQADRARLDAPVLAARRTLDPDLVIARQRSD